MLNYGKLNVIEDGWDVQHKSMANNEVALLSMESLM